MERDNNRPLARGTAAREAAAVWRSGCGTEQKGSSVYKNLSPSAIGILARQSELLEIALTHRFKGLEIDIHEVLRRAQASSVAQACRYLCSAKVKIGGFELPVRWSGDEKNFQTDLLQLGLILEVWRASAQTAVSPPSAPPARPPVPRKLSVSCRAAGKSGRRACGRQCEAGPEFPRPPPADRADGGFEFIHQAEAAVLLINGVQRNNVGLFSTPGSGGSAADGRRKAASLRGDQILSVRLADIPPGADLGSITEDAAADAGRGGHDQRAGHFGHAR